MKGGGLTNKTNTNRREMMNISKHGYINREYVFAS